LGQQRVAWHRERRTKKGDERTGTTHQTKPPSPLFAEEKPFNKRLVKMKEHISETET